MKGYTRKMENHTLLIEYQLNLEKKSVENKSSSLSMRLAPNGVFIELSEKRGFYIFYFSMGFYVMTFKC